MVFFYKHTTIQSQFPTMPNLGMSNNTIDLPTDGQYVREYVIFHKLNGTTFRELNV